MDNPPTPPPPDEPGLPGDHLPAPLVKIISLFVAFVPSLAAMSVLKTHSGGQAIGTGLLILSVICCVGASIGIVQGIKSTATQVALAVLLSGFFLVANLVIVVLVGCSQMGSI